MNVKQFANKNLVWIAGGTVAGMVGAGMLQGKLNNNYAKEIAGGSMFVVGSLMIAKGDTQVKKVGTGVGSAGLSLVGTGVYNRIASRSGMPDFSNENVSLA